MTAKRIHKTNYRVHDRDPGNGGHRWLTTFNDLVTLLMVFFVLLFSMGSLDFNRFKNFQNGLQSAMGVLEEGRHAAIGTISNESGLSEEPVRDHRVDDTSRKNHPPVLDAMDGLEATYTARGLHLTLNDRLLFSSGSAQLTGDGTALLDKVARVVKSLKRSVRVEGHTDNRPISTAMFPSNWELSTARAICVVKYLIQSGHIAPFYFSAAGYGDSKPRAPNDSEMNRAKNRRVEIILGRPGEAVNLQ